jgi:hypothetical protein
MVTGTGDAPVRKEAEKLAALSGVLQLYRLGLVSVSAIDPFQHVDVADS